MFRKNHAFRCSKDVPGPNGEAPRAMEGEVWLCTGGGKKPTLSNGSFQLAAGEQAMARYFAPADVADLPDHLKAEQATDKTAQQFKKGDVVKVTTPIVFGGNPSDDIPVGTLMRCARGGKSPAFDLPSARSLIEYQKVKAPSFHFAAAEPVVSPGLADLKVNIKTFEEMSEETLAMAGSIIVEGEKVHVKNDGHGGSTHLSGAVEALEARLAASVVSDPATPYQSAEEVMKAVAPEKSYTTLAEEYVEFAVSPHVGLCTFGDYLVLMIKERDERFAEFDRQAGKTKGKHTDQH